MQIAHLLKPALVTAAATLLLLSVPLVAMQLTSEVSWGWGDFLAAATLIFTAGMVYAAWVRCVSTRKQRLAVGFLVFGVMAMVWVELAIGLFR